LYCGASIDFVDVDPCTYNFSTSELERKLAAADRSGKLPKALILVHFAGQPCDLAGIAASARRYGITLIEDASHALGASYLNRPIGSCEYSDATVFSFFATKSIATGEGGMVLTNRERVARNVKLLRAHGIVHDTSALEPWRYEQVGLGFNYRMTDIQAALGASQLKKLDGFLARRRQLAARYCEGLIDLPLQLPYRDSISTPAWHLYPIMITGEARAARRRALYFALREHGIRSQVHYIPIHTQPYYRDLGFRAGDFPAAEYYYEGALSLPLFVDLAESDQDRVIEIVRATLIER
jgi:dTDP-4-amino-4,6-dideoxygalactose transaminase